MFEAVVVAVEDTIADDTCWELGICPCFIGASGVSEDVVDLVKIVVYNVVVDWVLVSGVMINVVLVVVFLIGEAWTVEGAIVDDDLGIFIGAKDIVDVNDDDFVDRVFVRSAFVGVRVGVGLDWDESIDGAMVEVAVDELLVDIVPFEVVLLGDDLFDGAMLEIVGDE